MTSTDFKINLEIPGSQYASLLRHELTARNHAYAAARQLPHVVGYGETPVVLYRPSECGKRHGNFIPASYRAILKRPEWLQRLRKVHTSGKYAFPREDYTWRELDSSMSSDALLMNVFCHPGVTRGRDLGRLLGTDIRDIPQFGFRPRIRLRSNLVERTEIDMKLGTVLFEAKLTEGDFQTQDAALVEQYCGLQEVFDRELPKIRSRYISYQLIRNVLAAHALDLSFCLLLDARRPDLLERWYQIARCIRSSVLRTRCTVRTWQELSVYLPRSLQRFLDVKYGIHSEQASQDRFFDS